MGGSVPLVPQNAPSGQPKQDGPNDERYENNNRYDPARGNSSIGHLQDKIPVVRVSWNTRSLNLPQTPSLKEPKG